MFLRLKGAKLQDTASDIENTTQVNCMKAYEFKTPKADARLILLLRIRSCSSPILRSDRIHAIRRNLT